MSDLRRGDDRADGSEVGEVDAVVTQPLVPLPALPADRLLVCATERYDEVLGQDQIATAAGARLRWPKPSHWTPIGRPETTARYTALAGDALRTAAARAAM